MKIHTFACKRKKLETISEETPTNIGSAGFCEDCQTNQTVVVRHKILVHMYSTCSYCKTNLDLLVLAAQELNARHVPSLQGSAWIAQLIPRMAQVYKKQEMNFSFLASNFP